MEPIVWLLHICPSNILEACVIYDQVHESYCQRCIYVTKSPALCASRAMAEKSMLAKVGKVMDSYFSGLESDVPLNYRVFLSWLTMLKMLKDTLLWSNYIYKGVSGGLSLRGMRNLSKGLLECVLQGNNYHGTSEHTTHHITIGIGCTWGHSTKTILELNLEYRVLIEYGSIVINHPQPNVGTCKLLGREIGPETFTKIKLGSRIAIPHKFFFDEAQNVTEKTNETAWAAYLNMFFDGVDMGPLEDYSGFGHLEILKKDLSSEAGEPSLSPKPVKQFPTTSVDPSGCGHLSSLPGD
nr:uncharacterized protein LOC117274790 [Nicotiana tomentosiformis]